MNRLKQKKIQQHSFGSLALVRSAYRCINTLFRRKASLSATTPSSCLHSTAAVAETAVVGGGGGIARNRGTAMLTAAIWPRYRGLGLLGEVHEHTEL